MIDWTRDPVIILLVHSEREDHGRELAKRISEEYPEVGVVIFATREPEVIGLGREEPSGMLRRPAPISTLTEREMEILRHLANGLTNKGIAERLGISPKTVSAHLRDVFLKLQVSGRTAAVAVAFRQGLME